MISGGTLRLMAVQNQYLNAQSEKDCPHYLIPIDTGFQMKKKKKDLGNYLLFNMWLHTVSHTAQNSFSLNVKILQNVCPCVLQSSLSSCTALFAELFAGLLNGAISAAHPVLYTVAVW